LRELPLIDDVLISHSHYDHLDAPSIHALGDAVRYWVPVGLSDWFGRRGIHRCTQMGWWESSFLSSDISIHCVPAQHGSGRTPFDRNRTHWCGWVLKSSERTIFFAGDTGYSPSFREIGERFGPIDLAMIPIGAYEPRWLMKSMHLNPADAVQVHIDIKSSLSVACHWGTYRLTDEPADEPPRLLRRELELRHIDSAKFRILQPGETLEV
jgi:N-acyl-phosphatidylethanolamine-hydrolysing phospholipase D